MKSVQPDPIYQGSGRLRNGHPGGNPNLAPRRGAKTRTGAACRAPAMKNGRCRFHGGKSTGLKTPEGRAAQITASTIHGYNGERGCALRTLVRDPTSRARLRASRLK